MILLLTRWFAHIFLRYVTEHIWFGTKMNEKTRQKEKKKMYKSKMRIILWRPDYVKSLNLFARKCFLISFRHGCLEILLGIKDELWMCIAKIFFFFYLLLFCCLPTSYVSVRHIDKTCHQLHKCKHKKCKSLMGMDPWVLPFSDIFFYLLLFLLFGSFVSRYIDK